VTPAQRRALVALADLSGPSQRIVVASQVAHRLYGKSHADRGRGPGGRPAAAALSLAYSTKPAAPFDPAAQHLQAALDLLDQARAAIRAASSTDDDTDRAIMAALAVACEASAVTGAALLAVQAAK
jgi:hypothetical protein